MKNYVISHITLSILKTLYVTIEGIHFGQHRITAVVIVQAVNERLLIIIRVLDYPFWTLIRVRPYNKKNLAKFVADVLLSA
jgi:hypothetical protein